MIENCRHGGRHGFAERGAIQLAAIRWESPVARRNGHGLRNGYIASKGWRATKLSQSIACGHGWPRSHAKCSCEGAAVPSDQFATGTRKTVSRLGMSLNAITGEPGKPAPQAVGSVRETKNI